MSTSALGVARRRASVFIAVSVAMQIGVPLAYYVGDGGYDERFRWRMFSSLGARTCEHVLEEEVAEGSWRPVDARAVAGASHLTGWGIVNYDPGVVRGFMAWRCRHAPVRALRFRARCRLPDGSALPAVAEEHACDEARRATKAR